jgi:hypothetical protein
MGAPDEIDELLALGSERPAVVEACTDESAIDDGHLLAYRRGTLDDGARDRVEAHLIGCPHCRDLVAHLEVRPAKRRWAVLVAGAAAFAAAIALFVITPPPKEPIGRYAIVKVEGEDSAFRGDGTQIDGRFNPHSQVTIKVEPTAGRPAASVRVFRLENGLLVDVPASVEAGTSGVFLIRGSGRELFGESTGAKRLVIVAADEGADLSRIAGRTLMAAQSVTTQASWLPVIDVDYRVD